MKGYSGRRTKMGCAIMAAAGAALMGIGIVDSVCAHALDDKVLYGPVVFGFALAVYGFSERVRHALYRDGDVKKSRLTGIAQGGKFYNG